MSERPKYEPIQTREFKSTIPAHLLGKLSDSERYVVETMSRLENQSDWLLEVAVENRKSIIDISERVASIESWTQKEDKRLDVVETTTTVHREKVDKLWDWKTTMSGKWAMLWAVGLVVLSVLLKYLMDLWVKKP